jgi:uncharacterized protein (TIGR04551 family)
MSRLPAAALAALLLLPGAARAQDDAKKETPSPETAKPDAAAAMAVDPKTQAAIREAIEKAKDDLRNEVRAEIQGAQSAAEFMGVVAEGPKLEFLQLDGYLRFRGELLDDLHLGRPRDASGHTLFPTPLDGQGGSTLATANMRLRIEPTFNVSEHARVKAQVDILDNYVLGSSTSALFDDPRSPYPEPFYGTSRRLTRDDPTADRDAILPKRAWGEVQTPVGLLSFGRMPSEWGVGILARAGSGLDDDFGDTVDRLQFALPPVATPLGPLTLIPILDFDAEGVLNADPRQGQGAGQPFDADSGDDARTYAIKIARYDTEDEVRRKVERGERSVNFGAYYNYRTQRGTYPSWILSGFDGTSGDVREITPPRQRRGAYAHVLDLWARWLSARWRVEAEAVGVYGSIANAFAFDPAAAADAQIVNLGRVLLRQWAAVLQTEYQAIPNKLALGVEVGAASGDSAPGFGNVPSRTVFNPDPDGIGTATPDPTLGADGTLPPYGSVEGPQFGQNGDHSIRNFRMNPGYRVDQILFRRILGQVTDALYVRPSVRWDIFPGVRFDGALIYSQAMEASSTPSAEAVAATDTSSPTTTSPYVSTAAYQLKSSGKKPLGVELDGRISLDAGDGFAAWTEVGVLQPLAGLGSGADARAWALAVGLAARF